MSKAICSVDGCDRDVHVKKRGLCKIHYGRWRKTGDVGPAEKLCDRPSNGAPPRTCSVEGCHLPYRAKGLCYKHYENKRLTGEPLGRVERPPMRRLVEVGWDVTESGCWEWRGNRGKHGYGRIRIGRVPWIVPRLVLSLYTPEPFPGAVTRHSCDNPPCMNPAHLSWGTVKDNSADMVARRREQSYRADWWNGTCKNGLHDITLPGAIVERHGSSRCRECLELGNRKPA